MNRSQQAAAGSRRRGKTPHCARGESCRSRPNQNLPPQLRRGFTLIELLVVIVIISILASMALGALSAARESARVAKTRSTIVKLDLLVQQQYQSYRTRRVPLSRQDIKDIARGMGWWNPNTEPRPSVSAIAKVRLLALRDIMRMEMPEVLNDIGFPGDPAFVPELSIPSLTRGYRRRLDRARIFAVATFGPGTSLGQGEERLARYSSAECLYMIVTMSSSENREMFMENEIGDADGDSLDEFHDAWGNPIKFLRWAPAFNDSDIQPNVMPSTLMEQGATWTDPAILQIMQTASEEDHDPFDPRAVDVSPDPTNPQNPPRGWRLVPLIFSAGPDGIYDISFGGTGFRFTGSPYLQDVSAGVFATSEIGFPSDIANMSVTAADVSPNGSLDHYDNIHNHRSEATR